MVQSCKDHCVQGCKALKENDNKARLYKTCNFVFLLLKY